MDADALYPSCKVKEAAAHIREAIKLASVDFQGVDRRFLCRYLAITKGKTGTAVDRFLPMAKGTTTLHSLVERDAPGQFWDSDMDPSLMNDNDKNQLVGWALTEALEVTYSHHYYTVGGQVFRQKDGGPQGLDTAVEASEVYMLMFDKKYLARLQQLGIRVELYVRYVDDITIILMGIRPGWYWEDDQLKYDVHHPSKDLPTDQRTMEILVAIANTIDKNLSFTVDFPSKHSSGRVPILDVEVWVENHNVRHSFYKKKMASHKTIMDRSAVPAQTKRNALFQEGIRRVTAMDSRITTEERTSILATFMDSLRASGYSQQYRAQILSGVLERAKQMRLEGLKYRNRQEIERAKAGRKNGWINTWFLKGSYTSVFQVQASVDGGLAGAVREATRNHRAPDGGKTLVVEKAGKGLLSGIKKPDPFMPAGCPFPSKCTMEKGACTSSRVVYKHTCGLCSAAYVGTTGHTCHTRNMQHLKAMETGDTTYPMVKHMENQHPLAQASDRTYSTTILGGSHIKGNLTRYITEAVAIAKEQASGTTMLNSRGEWARAKLRRLAVVSD